MHCATSQQLAAGQGNQGVSEDGQPKCIAIAAGGLETGSQFARFMSAMMGDLVTGRLAPNVGHAAVNAGGKLLKVVELRLKYGRAISLTDA